VRDVYHKMFTESPGKGPKTGIFNSIAFQKILTVEFNFAAISIPVCDEMLLRCLSRSGAEEQEVVGANFYPYTLLLDRVPQHLQLSHLIISKNSKPD
jgi:hypothetical protein